MPLKGLLGYLQTPGSPQELGRWGKHQGWLGGPGKVFLSHGLAWDFHGNGLKTGQFESCQQPLGQGVVSGCPVAGWPR